MTVNRTEFHSEVKAEFQTYVVELRDPANTDLRSKLRDKFPQLFENKAIAYLASKRFRVVTI